MTLGGKIEVPSIDGTTLMIDVHAGTTSGTVLRARGKGLPGLRGGSGDLLVTAVVYVPSRVNAQEKKLLEDLRKLDPNGRTSRAGKSVFDRMKDALAG
jgi:molecular chaperone DnaJ